MSFFFGRTRLLQLSRRGLQRCFAVKWLRTKTLRYATCTRVSRSWTVFSFLGALILRLTATDASSVMNTQTWVRPARFARKQIDAVSSFPFHVRNTSPPLLSSVFTLPSPLYLPSVSSLSPSPAPWHRFLPSPHPSSCHSSHPSHPPRLVLFKVGLSVSVSVCLLVAVMNQTCWQCS